ncbi:MAG: YIP1 family protein [Desulfobacterota bacterium]|jgi:hypothetical protein|nr:YIP1 family protein [Thermodesulfobacteriota bacterium]
MTIDILCPKCGYSKQLAEDKVPPGVRWATCPRCKERFDFTSGRGGTKPQGRISPPWERRAETGLKEGILQTVKGAAFSPRAFFRHTAVEGGLREPLAFGILFGSLGLMLELFWQFLTGEGSLSKIQMDFVADYGASPVFLASAILCPFAATAMICVTSLIAHLLLSVVGGGKNGFEATFRVVCYSQATQFWALLPYVGAWVASLWLVVVQLIGVREIHGVSYIRVLIAFLIPVVVVLAALMAAGVSLFLMD